MSSTNVSIFRRIFNYCADTITRFSIENAVAAVVIMFISWLTSVWISADASIANVTRLDIVIWTLGIALSLAILWVFVGIGWNFIKKRKAEAKTESHTSREEEIRPENQQTNVVERHYSSNDKDRISEAFFELSEILKKQADPLQLDIQNIIRVWEQGRQNDTYEEIDRTIKKLHDADSTASEINRRVYEELIEKYHRYENLLKHIIQVPGESHAHSLQMAIREFKKALREGLRIHTADPKLKGQIYGLMNATIRITVEANARFNGWIYDCRTRMDQKEKEILKDRLG